MIFKIRVSFEIFITSNQGIAPLQYVCRLRYLLPVTKVYMTFKIRVSLYIFITSNQGIAPLKYVSFEIFITSNQGIYDL